MTTRPRVGLLGGDGGGGPMLGNRECLAKMETRPFPFQSPLSEIYALAFRVWVEWMGVDVAKEL